MVHREVLWAAISGHFLASLPLLPFLDMIKLKLQASIRFFVSNPGLIYRSTHIHSQFHRDKQCWFSYSTALDTAAEVHSISTYTVFQMTMDCT